MGRAATTRGVKSARHRPERKRLLFLASRKTDRHRARAAAARIINSLAALMNVVAGPARIVRIISAGGAVISGKPGLSIDLLCCLPNSKSKMVCGTQ